MAYQSGNNNRRPGGFHGRNDRFEQNDRSDRGFRGDRQDRGPRSDRGFGPHSERGDRPGFRGDRQERGPRSDRGFGPRAEYNDRPGFRGERSDRSFGPRSDRNDRAPKPSFRPGQRPLLEAEMAEKTFRDFEYQAPVKAAPARPAAPTRPAAPAPEFEQELPPENLLAGRNPIREALKSGRDIEKLLVQRGELSGSAREIVQLARERHIIVQEVEKVRLDEITPHHQGMLAFASAFKYSTVEAMLELAASREEAPFLILLDGITDPHNLGAIIRTASCAGAHGVIVPERRSVGLTPAAVKASAGAVEHLPVARVTNLRRTLDELKSRGVWAYAVTMEGADYRKTDFSGGVALVIGSEGEGISRLVLDGCDQKVSLPLKGEVDSLNASVAAGIMMYRVMEGRA